MNYLIWSIEHNAWWAPNECGYVHSAAEAGIYALDVAQGIVREANLVEVKEAMVPERCVFDCGAASEVY